MENHQTNLPADSDLQIDRRTREFLKIVNSGGGEPIEALSPEAGRAVLVDVQHATPVEAGGISIEEKIIHQDGLEVKIHIIRPEGFDGVLPAFMFFHGGGWVLGDFPTHHHLVRDLVLSSGATAVFVNYSPSPEARFPTAINEAYAATKWVAAHGLAIGVDSSRLALAGNSVGGNMAAVVALMAKDKKGPAIRFQLLLWPVTHADFNTDSYQKYAHERFLTKSVMQYYWDSYTTIESERQHKYASPLNATLNELSGLPPAFIQVAENDVLRDEGEAYGRKLDQAGVPVTVVRYNGLIHDYGLLNALAEVPGVKSALLQAANELRFHLA